MMQQMVGELRDRKDVDEVEEQLLRGDARLKPIALAQEEVVVVGAVDGHLDGRALSLVWTEQLAPTSFMHSSFCGREDKAPRVLL
jgi:hypothetical protein